MLDIDLISRLNHSFSSFSRRKAITFYRDGRFEATLTYGELEMQVASFTVHLSSYTLKKENRVILIMEKSLVWVVAYLALLRLGIVSVPLNPGFKKRELEYLIGDAQPALILSDAVKKKEIKEIAPDLPLLIMDEARPSVVEKGGEQGLIKPDPVKINRDDPLLMVYTSGTTGNPKGAVLTNENLCHDAANIISVWEITQKDVLCHALPLFHIHGLCFALHTALIAGAHVIMLDKFLPGPVLERLLSKTPGAKVSMFMAVPTMYTRLIDHIGTGTYDFTHLRLLTSGSAPLLENTFEKIKTIFGKTPVEREGMSETGMNFSNPVHGEKKPGSIGIPLPNVAVRVVDTETRKDVEPGRVGELWIKSRSITKGYWNKPEQTAKAFEHNWFKTGDLGYVDEKGYYYLTDRIKHIIISGGENVSAKEVETVINSISGVKESAVVGIPDDKWGEAVASMVQLETGANISRDVLYDHCRKYLHAYKIPKQVVFSRSLPKNTMGKVLKEKVKKIILSGKIR